MESSLLCNTNKFNGNEQSEVINVSLSSKRRLSEASQPERKKQRIETKSHTAPPIDKNMYTDNNHEHDQNLFIANCKYDKDEDEQDMIKPSYPFTQSASPNNNNNNSKLNPTVTVLSSYDNNNQQSAPPNIGAKQRCNISDNADNYNHRLLNQQQSINLNVVTTNINTNNSDIDVDVDVDINNNTNNNNNNNNNNKNNNNEETEREFTKQQPNDASSLSISSATQPKKHKNRGRFESMSDDNEDDQHTCDNLNENNIENKENLGINHNLNLNHSTDTNDITDGNEEQLHVYQLSRKYNKIIFCPCCYKIINTKSCIGFNFHTQFRK